MSNDIPMIVMERRHTWFVGEEKQEEAKFPTAIKSHFYLMISIDLPTEH